MHRTHRGIALRYLVTDLAALDMADKYPMAEVIGLDLR